MIIAVGAVGVATLFGLTIVAGGAKLRRQARELEQMRRCTERMKTEFLGVLSHELRTPINALAGYACILEDELAGPLNQQQRAYVGKMIDCADTLLVLVNDMLDMGFIQAGKIALAPRAMEFPAVASDVATSLAPLAARKGQRITCDVPPDLPLLVADDTRVRQVLANLVGNAIKFGAADHEVRVRARVADGWLRCEVEDEGAGIAPEVLPLLFQPLTQGDMSSTRRVGGAGLGLSIAKALVEAHGGRIGAENVPGHGSRFWFTLPVEEGPTSGIRPA